MSSRWRAATRLSKRRRSSLSMPLIVVDSVSRHAPFLGRGADNVPAGEMWVGQLLSISEIRFHSIGTIFLTREVNFPQKLHANAPLRKLLPLNLETSKPEQTPIGRHHPSIIVCACIQKPHNKIPVAGTPVTASFNKCQWRAIRVHLLTASRS